MGFGSYDETEQSDEQVEIEEEQTDKMSRARYNGEVEQEDEDLDELMEHL